MLRRYSVTLAVVMAMCGGICASTIMSAHGEQEVPKPWEAQSTLNWKITGKITMAGGEKLPANDEIAVKIVKKYPELSIPDGVLEWWGGPSMLELSVGETGDFILGPRRALRDRKLKGMRDLEVKAQYKLLCMWKGRFTNVITFEVHEDPFSIKDVTLTFSPPVQHVYRARILDPETGKGVPNVKVVVLSWGGNDPKEKVGEWNFGECVSDADGLIRLESVPARSFTLREERWGAILPLGSSGTPQYPRWFGSLPKEASEKLKFEEIPVVYYVPAGKGMIWESTYIYGFGDGTKFNVPPGTILQFRGLTPEKTLERELWRAGKEPRFEVTVDDKGGVKTPMVPAGKYAVRAKNGLFEEERPIHEFSLSTGELEPAEEKQP